MFEYQNTTPHQHASNKRLREFDALRGFSMISVVFVHALNGTGTSAAEMSMGRFVISYFMPLFFFISGFFAYKPFDNWTNSVYKKQIPQKIKSLLVCTVVFYTFRYYIIGSDPFGWLYKGFMGYWFTIVLFDMFAIYYLMTSFCRLIKRDLVLPLMILAALAGPLIIHLELAREGMLVTIMGTTNLMFFLQWFVLGLIVKRYNTKFESILDSGTVKALLIVLYIVGLCGFQNNLPPILAKIIDSMIVPYIGVIVFVSCFYSFRRYFNGNSSIANALCFTGRRTLDIYMLHYFFLPSLPMLGTWLAPNSMVLFQLIYGLGMAVIITATCLLISSCLRTSPQLANWLFGVRQTARTV